MRWQIISYLVKSKGGLFHPPRIYMEPKSQKNKVKQTGYLVSAVGIIVSNIGLVKNWPYTPIIVLITMYFLAGSLWFPILIKPFYRMFQKLYKILQKEKDVG